MSQNVQKAKVVDRFFNGLKPAYLGVDSPITYTTSGGPILVAGSQFTVGEQNVVKFHIKNAGPNAVNIALVARDVVEGDDGIIEDLPGVTSVITDTQVVQPNSAGHLTVSGDQVSWRRYGVIAWNAAPFLSGTITITAVAYSSD